MTAICCRCQKPLACTLAPGELGLHAACSHAASDEAWASLRIDDEGYASLGAKEPTCRVVGVRRGGSRQVVAAGLSETRAAWERKKWRDDARKGCNDFARFVVEPEA